MGQDRVGFLGVFGPTDPLRRWSRAIDGAGSLSSCELSQTCRDIHAMRDRLDHLADKARKELNSRLIGEDGISRPDQCDWAARPGPWCERMRPRGLACVPSPTALPGGMTLFHDASDPQLCLRQEGRSNMPEAARGGALFGLVLEVYRFDGSFISLVHDLPDGAVQGLTLNHYITVDLRIEREHPVEIYARLNIQHGPNVENLVRQVNVKDGRGIAEFDMAYSTINEKRIEKAWLDLIVEGPEMTRIALWDMTLTRAPRADF